MSRRYLFLLPGLDPRQGGVQVSGIDAIQSLNAHELNCVVYGADPSRVIPLNTKSICDASRYRLALRLVTRRWPADAAVCWHISMLKLLPFARGFNGKVVAFLHGIELWRPHSPAMIRRLSQVDLFLSNSNFTWNELLKYAPQLSSKPHTTVPLGFGEPSVQAPPVADIPSVTIIARMSRAEDYKGHRELIDAWPQVLQSVPNARLDIVGEGDLRPELEKMVLAKSLTQNVIFHGRIDEETKTKLLQQCTAFAMPSRGEGFGIVYLEAMRFGRPCLVSDCDAGREVVNPPECGIEVNIRDLNAVAQAIVRLIDGGPQWQAWSNAARERYSRHFTVNAYQERLFQAIDSVLPASNHSLAARAN